MNANVSVTLDGRDVNFIKSEKGDWLRTVAISAVEGAKTKKIGFKQNSQDWLQAKSALRAAQDILRFGRYDHPQTTVGLHFMSEADIEEDGTNLGVVSAYYEGDLLTPPAPGQYPGDWAQVNRQNGTFYLSGFTERGRFARVRKHNWIDSIQCRGEGVEIGVTPWNNTKTQDEGLADKIMAVMLESDDAKANQMRLDGFAQAQMVWQIGRVAQQNLKSERQGIPVRVTKEPLIVTDVNGEMLNMFEVAPCQVRVYDANGHSRYVPWNGTADAIKQFRSIAMANGYTVEPL